MDARGHQYIPDVGVIALINLSDVSSRVKLISYPCWLGHQRASRHPTTEDYQLVLRLAFSQWGLPDRLSVDHDSVFYDNLSPSPFPTRLHLWLVALGVQVTFARRHRPTDQAIIERSHQTWFQQVVEGQRFPSWQALYEALNHRRAFLNYQLPCARLGEKPPLVAHPEAQLVRRPYRPEWEAELLGLSRVHSYLSQGRWFRLVSSAGTVALGGQVYYVERAWARQQVEITFEATDGHLVVRGPETDETQRLPIRGIAPRDLMGEMGPLMNLNHFQLALPFTWDGWRMLQLSTTLPDTTFLDSGVLRLN
jgi:hypothetical protein